MKGKYDLGQQLKAFLEAGKRFSDLVAPPTGSTFCIKDILNFSTEERTTGTITSIIFTVYSLSKEIL
jgi:hypothetical protein